MSQLVLSDRMRKKLSRPDHDVTLKELEECFENREKGFCVDSREDHATNPQTLWFVAMTNKNRRLKIMCVIERDGRIFIKSAYPANDNVTRIYERYAPEA